MKLIKIILIVFAIKNIVFCNVGSASYQKLGMDARSIAMGRSATGISRGSNAVFWNPANLCKLTENVPGIDMFVTNMSNKNYDIGFMTSAFSMQWEKFGLGLGFMNYSVGEIESYDRDMNFTGNFDNTERSIFFGFGSKIPYVMNYGLSLVYYSQGYSGSITSEVSNGLGIIGGISFFPFNKYKNLSISMSYNSGALSNTDTIAGFNTDMRSLTSAGFAWKIIDRDASFFNKLLITSEVEQETDFPLKLKFGSEVFLANLNGYKFIVRAGMDDFNLETREDNINSSDNKYGASIIDQNTLRKLNLKTTFGFGLEFPTIRIFRSYSKVKFDYAYVNEAFRDLHFFTIGLSY